jgi:hypothetical protein
MRIHFLFLRTPQRPRRFSHFLPLAMIALSVATFAGCAGGGSNYNPPPPPNSAPSLSANAPLSPSSATAGGPAFTLTVTGRGFLSSSTVQWNGSPRGTTFVSSTSLQAAITAADIATAGLAMVTVVTPSPGGGTSAPATFTINNPTPTTASLNPNSALAGGAAFTLTITGTNFVSTSSVQWNGTTRTTTFVSNTSLQAAITAADIATAGTATVTVVNAAPGGGTSGDTTFTINNPMPTATSLNPASAFAGSTSFILTVTGTGFVASSAVQWNGSARTTTFVSNTSLQAAITAGDIASVGTAMVTVSNPAPGGGTSGPLTFSITVPPPAITLLNPSSAIMSGAAFTLAVMGTNFVSASAVQWNGSARTTTFVSTTELQAAITAADIATIGTAKVTVVNPPINGGTSMASTFFVGSSGGANFAVIPINQAAQDIVFDPKNQVFYLSVTGTDPNHPNTISVLDPSTGTITSSMSAGSNPNVLAISDDSQFLYAGIDGSASVQRFTLPGLVKDISYPLVSSSVSGPLFALDLQVAPGAPHTTAVSIGASGSPSAQVGVQIFDDATPRPTIAKGFGPGGGGGVLYDSLQWGTDATTLFAANNEDTGFDFYTLSVNSSGVALTTDYPNTFSSFSERIHFDSGTKLIYADGGLVLDPSPGLPVGNFNTPFLTVPDSTLNTAFIIPNSISNSAVIESFDLTHFTPISSITIPSVSANPTRFIRWGQNGLAFITGGPSGTPQVFLVGGNFVSPAPTFIETPPPTPAPAPTPAINAPAITQLSPSSAVAGGTGFTMNVSGTNFVASSTVQWNGSPRSTTFVSSTQLHAVIATADLTTSGTVSITVSNPSTNGGVSAASTFFIGATGGTSSTGTGFAVAVVNQASKDLVFDPAHGEIFLSVPNTVANGNTISVLDLATATIVGEQFAGSSPDVLAMSDDNQFLYAGIHGSASVQRFTLPALAQDIDYSLGTVAGGPFALDLQVAPGFPHTTAVTLAVSSSTPSAQGGITIFDDGTARPTIAKGFGPGGGGDVLYDSLQWGSDATTLFAANDEDTGFDFYTLSVNSSGVSLNQDFPGDFSTFSNRIHFDSGTKLVYADDGHVVNPSTGSVVGNFGVAGPMVPDSTLNAAFFIISGSPSVTIESFNLTTFAVVSSVTIPNVTGNPLRLIRWGQNGLAFNTDGGEIVLVGGSFVH